MARPNDVTALTRRAGEGDSRAIEQLMPLIYDELCLLASRFMRREAPDHTLQTTALAASDVYSEERFAGE